MCASLKIPNNMPTAKQRATPKVGTEFSKKYKHKLYKLKVVKAQGGVAYDLNGVAYKSPSSAAKSLTKAEVNGWRFWKMT
jgi:hypothetical protein